MRAINPQLVEHRLVRTVSIVGHAVLNYCYYSLCRTASFFFSGALQQFFIRVVDVIVNSCREALSRCQTVSSHQYPYD